ncbi:MAG TPA: PQQ-dependent sugar dehydrogenase [Kofleriaceae bacterium]|jgi:glucose/arabinose dehydrogenase|nr:PQQ-dependent sugar dehydrogenase [Kofleriaceae bacterium]
MGIDLVPRLLRAPGLLLGIAAAAGSPACGDNAPPRSTTCPGGTPFETWVSDPHYCVYVFATGLGGARQMAFAPSGELFVNNGSVTVLADDNGDGSSTSAERSAFGTAPHLNHGLAFSRDGKYVYASSATTVYRWGYTAGMREAAKGPDVVVSGIPDGGHVTRTLVFDSLGRLYVSVGSASNVDTDPVLAETRSQVRRFEIPDPLPAAGLDYAAGEIVASGMRNEVGLYADAHDRLWGVENGRDNLTEDSGDIHNSNPAEEVNLIDGKGSHYYGYPSCYSEYLRSGGRGPGAQWADQSLAPEDRKTDAWCRDPANVHPPVFALPAHWAPLGILAYQGSALPLAGDLLVTAHGSWDADPAVGRVVARLHRDGDAITSVEPLIGERGPGNVLRQGTWNVRPVDVREGPDGALYFSDDMGGRVFKVTYTAP